MSFSTEPNCQQRRDLEPEEISKKIKDTMKEIKWRLQLYDKELGLNNQNYHPCSNKSSTIQEDEAKIASSEQPTENLEGNPITYEGKVFNQETGRWENPTPTKFSIDSKSSPNPQYKLKYNSKPKDVFKIPEFSEIPFEDVYSFPNYKRDRTYPFNTLGFLLRVMVPDGMDPGTAYLHICGMCLRVVPIYKVGRAYVIAVPPKEGWNIVGFSKYAYQEGYKGIKVVTFNEKKTTWTTATPWFHPEHLQVMKEVNRFQNQNPAS